MSSLLKIERVICFTFVLWLLSTSFYSLLILGLRQKVFTFQANGCLLTDAQETVLLQRERGGIRRKGGNGGRNILKATLGDRSLGNGLS
jgi:hypothetical protein